MGMNSSLEQVKIEIMDGGARCSVPPPLSCPRLENETLLINFHFSFWCQRAVRLPILSRHLLPDHGTSLSTSLGPSRREVILTSKRSQRPRWWSSWTGAGPRCFYTLAPQYPRPQVERPEIFDFSDLLGPVILTLAPVDFPNAG
jgi:hypothetical protein